MTISECVQAVLIANAALVAAVPAVRIKVPGNWQNMDRPYIQHFPVTVQPVVVHQGLKAGKRWSYQVDVYADTMGEAEDVAFLAVAALHGTHQCGTPASDNINAQWREGAWYVGRDAEVEVEHFIVQFDIAQTPA